MSLVGSAILLILADFACTFGDLSSDEGPCVRENAQCHAFHDREGYGLDEIVVL